VKDGIPLKILEGSVHARQDTLELRCDKAIYNEKDKILNLHAKQYVCLTKGTDSLFAKEVRFFEQSEIAIAQGDVKVFRPGQYMEADYLEYHYENDQIRASGNLLLYDMENTVYLTAESGEYLPKEKFSYVRSNAHLWRIDSTTTDTLHIYSKQMEYHSEGSRRAIARDSVKILQGKLQAICDSAKYLIDEDVIFLESKPEAIQENNKMFGKRMKLVLEDQELKQIRVSGNAFAISVIDSLLVKENRLEGREIIMYITERKMSQIYAVDNARSFYHLKEKGEDRGINVASADTIKAFLQDNELDSIAVIGGSQGIFYPQDYKGKIIEE
jgi:lipopolysaccharide export system protein LptA